MATDKREEIESISRLADEVTTIDIIEELYFKQQIDTGLRDVAEGRTLSHEELKERIGKWRKSAGR